MVDAPGWTRPLVDDGWVGDSQRFPTARQIVCWTNCPTCGAARGEYCKSGLVEKKTGEMLDLDAWLAMNGVSAPGPSCDLRRQRGRAELKKRVTAEKRRKAQIEKAVRKVLTARSLRRQGKADQADALF